MKQSPQKIIAGSVITLLVLSIIALIIYYFFFLKPEPIVLHQPEFKISEEQQKEIEATVAEIEAIETKQEQIVIEQEKQLQQNQQTAKTIDVKRFAEQQKRVERTKVFMERQGAVLPDGRFDFNPN
jgi:uncharacterized membrane protein YhiD involved in acid resistance